MQWDRSARHPKTGPTPYRHFLQELLDSSLNNHAKEWIHSLKSIVSQEISLLLSLDDFKKFFKHKQERTASSPSGRHMGHYQTMLECIHQNQFLLPEIIISMAYIALSTATPLHRWQMASHLN
jgi:hypothetical protein